MPLAPSSGAGRAHPILDPLVIGGIVLVLVLIGISLYSAALNRIYLAEVYLHAVGSRTSCAFDQQPIFRMSA